MRSTTTPRALVPLRPLPSAGSRRPAHSPAARWPQPDRTTPPAVPLQQPGPPKLTPRPPPGPAGPAWPESRPLEHIPASLEERLTAVEVQVAGLRVEVERLREEVAALRAARPACVAAAA